MRILKLALIGLFLSSPAFATSYYFSNSSGGNLPAGSNSNPCTSTAAPCNDFKGTTLDNANALSPGDIIYLDGGDTWEGSTAEVRIISNGTAASPIKLLSYGGTAATLKATVTQASGWTFSSTSTHAEGGGIYYIGSVTFTESHLYSTTESNSLGLFKWGSGYGSNTLASMPKGHFWFDASANRVYVNTWGGENPNTLGTVSVPNFVQSPSANGLRGLVCTGCENPTYGNYIHIGDSTGLNIVGANGVGVSLGGIFNKTTSLNIVGAGKDGWLTMHNQISGEEADDATDDGSTVTYSAASGTGHGQAWTTYAPRTLWVNSVAHHNAMAGFDWLQGWVSGADVRNGACKNCTAYKNGIWGDSRGFDANYYVDGAHDILIKDSYCYDGGGGSGINTTGASNDRPCINIGSENPSNFAAYNVDIVNNFVHNTNYFALQTQNIPASVDNITGIRIIGNTIIARRSGSELNHGYYFADRAATANGFTVKYNILYGESGDYVNHLSSPGAYLNSDYNLYYIQGGSSNILHSCSGCGGTAYTLATWRTANASLGNDDANSVNADPKFVTDTQGSFDVHLQATSPAINAAPSSHGYTCPSWVYSQWPTYFPECATGQNPLQGTTLLSGTPDTGNLDLGFHFPTPTEAGIGTFTSANIEPGALTVSTAGTLSIQFTNENSWDANGKLVLALPSNLGNWTFSSGGASAASCISGCDGLLSFSSTTNTITLTRASASVMSASTATVISVTNVMTPSGTGVLSNYSLQTQTTGGDLIDEKTDISGDTLVAVPTASGSTYSVSGAVTFTGTVTLKPQ